ncbi:MAG: hypothetical protein PHN45_00195 [Methylococcales bacterium]|nr:hypothetical protein [Methylococcales bacterium]
MSEIFQHQLGCPIEDPHDASETYANLSMVIDVEALVFPEPAQCVVEQIGFCIVDDYGNTVTSSKINVSQPYYNTQLSTQLGVDINLVNRSIYFYEKITHDSYIHTGACYVSENTALDMVVQMAQASNSTVYAKGCALEKRVFGDRLVFEDLEWYACPKYPHSVHDPLQECLFFAKFIPSMIALSQTTHPSTKEYIKKLYHACIEAPDFAKRTPSPTKSTTDITPHKRKTYAEAASAETSQSPKQSCIAIWNNDELQIKYV